MAKGGFTSKSESIWELHRGGDLYNIVNAPNIHLIMASFIVCKFYFSEPFFRQKKENYFQVKKLK